MEVDAVKTEEGDRRREEGRRRRETEGGRTERYRCCEKCSSFVELLFILRNVELFILNGSCH
jgi:hypothetical protein